MKKEGGGGARQRRPRARSATRGVRPAGGGARVGGGERGKRRGEKGGARFAAAGHDASHWMGRALKSGVGQEKILGLGFRV